jgi:hypothetical protein
MKIVSAILWKMLVDETHPQRMIELDLIAFTSFDRLIQELIKEEDSMAGNVLFDKVVAQAISLEHKWHQRFKSQ